MLAENITWSTHFATFHVVHDGLLDEQCVACRLLLPLRGENHECDRSLAGPFILDACDTRILHVFALEEMSL
jgi:hypothetical protein